MNPTKVHPVNEEQEVSPSPDTHKVSRPATPLLPAFSQNSPDVARQDRRSGEEKLPEGVESASSPAGAVDAVVITTARREIADLLVADDTIADGDAAPTIVTCTSTADSEGGGSAAAAVGADTHVVG